MAKKRVISKEVKIASFASLLRESDRGCVLLVVNPFDRTLERILEAEVAANFAQGGGPKNFFRKYLLGNRGPLSSFFDKINLAYAFGLINQEQYEALHAIRDLRNEAAHGIFVFNFRDLGVVDHLKKLKQYDAKIDEDNIMEFELLIPEASQNMTKFHFVVCCHILLQELQETLVTGIENILEKRAEAREASSHKLH